MSLKLPQPGPSYSQGTQQRANQAIEAADVGNRKKGQDVEISSERLVLHSPTGLRWEIIVSDTGALSTVQVTT
jgi:hypothetical protein